MDINRFLKTFGTVALSTMMVFSMVPQNILHTHAEEIQTYADDAGYIGQIASLSDIKISDNVIDITTNANEKIKLTFMSDTMFRFNLEPKGNFVEEPSTNNSKYTGKMLVKPVSEYEGVTPTVTEDAENYIIQTPKVALFISKADSKMKMVNMETGVIEWSEKEPLQYGGGKTIQTLNTSEDEYFYGGGMQNGYFSHKNKKINIFDKADSGNWGDGMTASPAPFYMSTSGYGVMRYTWATGQYDFDSEKENTVKTMHNENRFDAIYFSGSSLNDALNQYTTVTGRPVLMPEYSYYLGHANCYNRDYWVEDENGKYEFNGKHYREAGESNPGNGALIETLNGENGGVSARMVLDKYQQHDMPLGWFLPNDGYGCGYGQDDTDSTPNTPDAEAVDINIANLKAFSDYANERGVEVGLWTQSDLVPTMYDADGKVIPPHLRRDFEKEVQNGGVKAIKTDVAWVGAGGPMALNSVMTAANTITDNTGNRPFIVSLFGWNGTQRYASIWSGDQTGGLWEYIRFHIPSYIGLGLSGNPNVGSDMDGIYGGTHADIQTRDYQWKAFTPVQIDMDGWGSSVKNPATFGGSYEAINRMYLKLKAQMLPYYYSAAYEANQTGLPTLRAMVLEYPDDAYARTTATQYQYMWGENLLVAPIYQNTAADETGNDIRNNIYLPDENQVWIDYFTGKQYQGGSVLNSFDAPIWKLPVFVKNGAIIPMTVENNSPSDIASDATRIFDVYPAGDTSYDMFEDDGNTYRFEDGYYANTEITSSAPVTGEGTATITVNKAKTGAAGVDYTAATGKDKQRATEVKVHVQKAPTDVTLNVGGVKTELTKAEKLEEYLNSDGNVYFYDEAPLVETYTDDVMVSEDDSKLTLSPILYVKAAKTDITANDVQVVVEGFNNTEASGSDGMEKAPATPTNLISDEEANTDKSIALSWDAVTGDLDGATSYDLRIGGADGVIFSNIKTNAYVHEDLTQDTMYTYEVRAVNSVGASAWSDPINVKTKLDPWRNVPENLNIELNQPSAWDVKAVINRNKTDNWFSEYNDAEIMAATKVLTLDLGATYNMDKLELYGIPFETNNSSAYDSHRLSNINLEISNDGAHWKMLYEDLDLTYIDQLASIDLQGTTTQFIRITVNAPTNNYIAFSEIVPYKADGTKAHATGDVNGDGVADTGDLTFMKNYIGIHDTSTTWVQVAHADYNFNGMIDGYDLAFVNAWSTIHYKETAKQLSGAIVAMPSKNELKKGEEFTVDFYGVDMNDVDGFSFELNDTNGKFDIVSSAVPATAVNNMLFYPGKDNARIMAAAVNTNEGRGAPMNGTVKLASAILKAREDTVFDAEIVNAIIVNTQYASTDANPVYASNDAEFPAVEEGSGLLTVNDNFTISSTTADKFQTSSDLKNAVDGNHETLSELKWNAAAEMPLNYTLTLNEVKEIKKVDVAKRITGNGILKEMQMIGYLNGKVVYDETLISEKEDYLLTFELPEGTKLDKIEINALDSYNANDSTKYLTIREIEVYEKGSADVNGIKLVDTINALKYGGSALFSAVVTPPNAKNPYYTVESSDPAVSVQRIQNANGAIAYLLTAEASQDNSPKTVTITARTKEGDFSVSQDVILYADNEKLPHAGMKASASSETPAGYENPGTAVAVLDDNYETYWHSDWTKEHALPEWIQIELAEAKLINMIDFTPRQKAANGYILDYEVQVSMTGEEGTFESVATGTLPKSDATKQIAFNPVNAKFVRLIAKSANDTGNDAQVAAISEMNVYETKVSMNKDALNDAITAAEALLEEDYTVASWEVFAAALETAKTVAEDPEATQQMINDVTTALAEAQKGLIEKADKTELGAALDDAEKAVNREETYTTSSYAAFYAVYEEAVAVFDQDDATTEAVNEKTAELNVAMSKLEKRVAEWLVDSFNEHVEAYRALADNYTEEEFADMAALIEEADALLAKDPADIATKEITVLDLQLLEAARALNETADPNVLLNNLKLAITFANQTLGSDEIENVRPGKVKALEEAVEAGQYLVDTASEDRVKLKEATTSIIKATQELWLIVDKEALANLIDLGTAKLDGNFTTATKAILADAIEAAQSVYGNDDATEAEVKEAYGTLADAISGLKKLADKEALKHQMDIAEDVLANIDNYMPSTVAGLEELLEEAKAIYNDENATQDVVTAMTEKLTEANMKAKTKADKTALGSLIANAEEIVLEQFTAESAATLTKVLDECRAVFANENATEEEVKLAEQKMKDAINGLVLLPSADPDKDDNQGSTTNPGTSDGDNGNGAAGSNGSVNKGTTHITAANTGDTTNANAWIIMMLLGGVAIAGFVIYRSKKEHK